MLIESMAGKSGSMHGMYQDATPFQFHEENRVIDYLGQQLTEVRRALPVSPPTLSLVYLPHRGAPSPACTRCFQSPSLVLAISTLISAPI